MVDIKLFVCCHKLEFVPKNTLLVPIQVGTALSNERFKGFFHDDEGDNISDLNRSYCELTAHYWTWKNISADYYGFFHYRRYLYPDTKSKKVYIIEKEPTEKLMDRLGYGEFENLIEQYDLIIPKPENMYISVREHYESAPYHHGEDLKLVEDIIHDKYPEYMIASDKYLSGTNCYFGNIFIMKKRLFYDYCKWLFSILGEFDKRADVSCYCQQEARVNGYLAERLFGIWLTCQRTELNVCELPRVHFVVDDKQRKKSKLLNIFLPPGSKERAFIKGIKNR